ncbi:MAG: four-carbon acid sugar kinase family protein [Ferroplasma sp.]
MAILVLSDDLTGAAGFASMVGTGIITVPFENLPLIDIYSYKIVSVDLETRNSDNPASRINSIIKNYRGAFITIRIDSFLRGNIKAELKPLSGIGKILLTDTIPEFGRYTVNKKTVYKLHEINLQDIIPVNTENEIYISDSASDCDLSKIAQICLINGYIPVDPGPLIKKYLDLI